MTQLNLNKSGLIIKDLKQLTKTNMKTRKFYRSKYAKEIKRQAKLVVGITGLRDDFKLCEKYLKLKICWDFTKPIVLSVIN